MKKEIGLVVMGIAVGLVLTELIREEEKQRAAEEADRRNGLFAEINGNKVRMYEVRDGHFCGYTETREFASQEEAMEWVAKETSAKMVIRDEE